MQEGLDQILYNKKNLDHISQKHDESLKTPYVILVFQDLQI